jgi:ATP-dependent DNA ligase
MKAKDLRGEIEWNLAGAARFSRITRFFNDKWIMEPKLDGARLLLHIGTRTNVLKMGHRSVRTFAHTDRSDQFPHLRDASMPEFGGTVLDGELIAATARIRTQRGTWTASLLNASVALCNSNPADAVQTQQQFGFAQMHTFDVLSFRGVSVQALPLSSRRDLLRFIVTEVQSRHPLSALHLMSQHPSSAHSIDECLQRGFEGVVVKDLASSYEVGKRSRHWLKIKQFSSADAFVVGYSPGRNGNAGLVGSLELAVLRSDGSIRPVARVANLRRDLRIAISTESGELRTNFMGTVMEFSTQGIGKNGRARSASLIRIRSDKSPLDCDEAQLENMPRV